MNLHYYYWYFPSVIPHRICDDIIEYGKSQQEEIALTGQTEQKEISEADLKILHKKRKSNVVWMNDSWIYREIHPFIHLANRSAEWNFDWDWSETCQFTKYAGSKKQHYDWHCDSNELPYNKPDDKNTHGKIRNSRNRRRVSREANARYVCKLLESSRERIWKCHACGREQQHRLHGPR